MENKLQKVAKEMNEVSLSVIGDKAIEGFEKAYQMATAIDKLDELLTPEYMKPILALQGNKLGFLTDKDRDQGYPEKVVKKCLIEAVLSGLQPYGNQFNIIAGNMYPTKEGCGYRLNNMEGLSYELVCSLPKINGDRSSAAVDVNIKWTINNESKEKTIPIPIKMDKYTSVDAVIGKATRKGRAWLISTLTGMEVTDGDVKDVDVTVVESTTNKVFSTNEETARVIKFIKECKTREAYDALLKDIPAEVLDSDEVVKVRLEKRKEFK